MCRPIEMRRVLAACPSTNLSTHETNARIKNSCRFWPPASDPARGVRPVHPPNRPADAGPLAGTIGNRLPHHKCSDRPRRGRAGRATSIAARGKHSPSDSPAKSARADLQAVLWVAVKLLILLTRRCPPFVHAFPPQSSRERLARSSSSAPRASCARPGP